MISVGSYLPERVVTNEELASFVDTSDEWIASATASRSARRRRRGKDIDLACNAAQQALDRAGLDAGDIDLLIIATSTPDDIPSTATRSASAWRARCRGVRCAGGLRGFV